MRQPGRLLSVGDFNTMVTPFEKPKLRKQVQTLKRFCYFPLWQEFEVKTHRQRKHIFSKTQIMQ